MSYTVNSIIFVSMEVNDELVNKLAALAHLHFNASEKNDIREDLQRMISFVEKLKEVDTENIPPLLHMSAVVDRFREDIVQGSVSREEAMLNAPLTDDVFFKVPKVIKK
ncbi:MAG TPA: Asp-tRNA(Asn)/Glu-tRNA(Gln) amidotransferase subunit GatC [Flavitalea sp.]|nr:Asp-tRNA(Asn)/Glu-tRNA(Gln) amidotransferase subunit GatC [Flavitalea sp.]